MGIGVQDPHAEDRLVEPETSQTLDVLAIQVVARVPDRHETLRDIERHYELQLLGFVSHDPDRIDGDIGARRGRDEPGER